MKRKPVQYKSVRATSGSRAREGRLEESPEEGGQHGAAESAYHGASMVRETMGIMSVAAPHVRSVSRKVGGNIVNFLVRTEPCKTAAAEHTPAQIIQTLKLGLPVQELDDLRSSLDVSMERLVPMLGISKATLHRRMAAGRLDPAESDRVVRFARLMGRAVMVMESVEGARRWLSSPQIGLGGAVPLEYAETEVGAREVENLLGRIEYGVYA